MDFGNPVTLMSGIFIGLVGMAIFMYGKKQTAPRPMVAGALLCVYPYFVTSAIALWTIFAAIVGGLYWLAKNE